MTTKNENNAGLTSLTDPTKKKEFTQILASITHYMSIMDQQKEAIKDIIDDTSEKFDIDKKLIRKLSSVMYKSNYDEVESENESLAFLYESITDKPSPIEVITE